MPPKISGNNKVARGFMNMVGRAVGLNTEKQSVKLVNNLAKQTSQLRKLANQRILSLDTATKAGRKQAEQIRNARKALSDASKAETEFLQKNPQYMTKLKSGSFKINNDTATQSELAKIRQNIYKNAGIGKRSTGSIVSNGLSKLVPIGKGVGSWAGKHKKGLGTLAALGGLGYLGSKSEPVKFYINDLIKGGLHKLGIDTKGSLRTEENMSDEFNTQAQELAALTLAMKERGIDVNGLEPYVYQVYNKSHGHEAKYADFSNILNFFKPSRRVEYSDGGMSMKSSKHDKGYNVVLSDEAAWDPDPGKSYDLSNIKNIPRGLPVALGVTKEELGDNTDKMRYSYNIPQEKVDSMGNVYDKYSKIIAEERNLNKKV